jgi:DNA-3-methyladenine glycosylase I
LGALNSSDVAAQHHPSWWYRGTRPRSDNEYFENLCRILFQTGLNWAIVEKKWITIKPVFCGFEVDRITAFTDADVQRLLADKGIIRNRFKLHAIIENAKQFQQIRCKYGNFQTYLDSFDKSNNYAEVVKALSDRFERIGPTTAALFLFSVGENIKPNRMY